MIELMQSGADERTTREVLENLRVLYGTRAGEQALCRGFGIDWTQLDRAGPAAEALMAAEFVRKTQMYEPRAAVMRVEWDNSQAMDGSVRAKVVVSIVGDQQP